MLRRRQATQFTKNRMWRPSSAITGSKVSTNSSGKKPERLAVSNRPKAKKLSMHSEKPVTRNDHSGSLGVLYCGSGSSRMP